VSIIVCPSCKCQIELRASFASGPKSKEADVDTSSLGQLLDAIDVDTLTGRDAEFVQKQKERFEQYGTKTLMSPRQMSWLRDLAGKGF
jgi:hypothetical protein